MLKYVAIALLVAAGFIPARAAEDLADAKKLYFKGIESDSDSLTRATQILAALAQQDKTNATILVYRGSLRLLEAAHSWALLRKGEMAREGLAMMDDAVTAQPDDGEIRFIRAVSTYHLPGFFKRRAQTETDFDWLAKNAAAQVKAGRLDSTLGAAALFHHGLIEAERDHPSAARASWEAAVSIGPDTRAGKDAAKKLATLPASP